MTATPSTPNNTKKNNNKVLVIILSVLFGISLISSILLYSNKVKLEEQLSACDKEVDFEQKEKDAAIAELNLMLRQYDDLTQQNQTLSNELLEEKEKIKKLIEQAKNKDFTINKLRKETETLREIMKGYVHTIDSLNTLNQNLTVENLTVKGELSTQKEMYTSLDKEKRELAEKVKVGSLLQAINIKTVGQIKKSSGANKDTDKASRTDVVKCCFVINENKIARAGKRNVYLRIISPFGSVLGEQKDDEFTVNGHSSIYTAKKEIDYNTSSLDVCMYWDVNNPLTKGDYIVQLFSDGLELGSSKFTLK